MATAFLDTNALLKLYLSEKGTAWLKAYVVERQIIISELAIFECATVLRRRYIEQTLTEAEAAKLFIQIKEDSENFTLIALGGEEQLNKLQSLAFSLPTTLRIRALDGIIWRRQCWRKKRRTALTRPNR